MDFPAAGNALWAIYDATGIRPEWLIPGLAIESGLNPSLPNAAGYPYYGISQISGSFLEARGIDPSDYLTWSASQQLQTIVLPYMQGVVNQLGPLDSGIRVYQANFYPASLAYAPGLDDVIVSSSSADGNSRAAYAANKYLDADGNGEITPRDLGARLSEQVAKGFVQSAISQTYALRPSERPTDPVFGATSLLSNLSLPPAVAPIVLIASIGFLAITAVSYIEPTILPKWLRMPNLI
jgi:hypothetical protein